MIPVLKDIYIRKAKSIVPAYEDLNPNEKAYIEHMGGYYRELERVANVLIRRERILEAFTTGEEIKVTYKEPDDRTENSMET